VASVYSKVLYLVSGLSGDSPAISAPPGSILIVRDIDVYCGLTGIETLGELHWRDLTSSGAIALWTFDITDTDKKSFQWFGRQVFDPAVAGSFGFHADAASWDIRVSGYILTD
jgi:hypothetical protein